MASGERRRPTALRVSEAVCFRARHVLHLQWRRNRPPRQSHRKGVRCANRRLANEALFRPLGINDWQLKDYRNGKQATAAGLRLRPRDAAKVGQLVLDNGAWQGRRIVSAEWIAESVKPRFQATNMFGGLFYYGYQWWIGRTLVNAREIKWVAGQGLGGQRLIIVPGHELVMMVTQGLYPSDRQGQVTLDLLANFVLPAVRTKDAR